MKRSDRSTGLDKWRLDRLMLGWRFHFEQNALLESEGRGLKRTVIERLVQDYDEATVERLPRIVGS